MMSCIELQEKPCAVRFLDNCDRFIIGTYEQELDETVAKTRLARLSNKTDSAHREEVANLWKNLNGRFGSLIVVSSSLESNEVISTTPCVQGGGVFDLVASANDDPHRYTIFTAHSNGCLGCYTYENDVVSALSVHKVGNSDLLTCIDLTEASDSERLRIAVGDSNGLVSICNQSGAILAFVNTNSSKLSIWQVKFFHAGWLGKVCLFVTIDDSTWFIYDYDDIGRKLSLVHKSLPQDFNSGITNVSFLRENRLAHLGDELLVLMGSYDQSIKLYSIRVLQDQKPIKFEAKILGQSEIPDGGIWRIKCLESDQSNQAQGEFTYNLYIAAMYAESVLLKLGIKPQPGGDSSSNSEVRFEGPKRLHYGTGDKVAREQPLHYGIDISSAKLGGERVCCATDFNSRLCYLFRV